MFCGSSEVGNVLGLLEVLVDVLTLTVQLVGEVAEVAGNKTTSLVLLHVVVVEVPIETGFAFFLQLREELLLDLLQQIEPHKEVAVVGVIGYCFMVIGYHGTVERTLVGETLLG